IYLFPGFYFETGSDIYISVLQRGIMTAYPEGMLHNYGIYIFISHVFAWLHKMCSAVNWFNIFILATLTCIFGNILFLLNGFRKKIPHNFFSIILFAALIIIGLEAILYLEPARTSALLTATSMLCIISLLHEERLTKKEYVFFTLLCGLGYFIRIESALLITAVVLPPFV